MASSSWVVAVGDERVTRWANGSAFRRKSGGRLENGVPFYARIVVDVGSDLVGVAERVRRCIVMGRIGDQLSQSEIGIEIDGFDQGDKSGDTVVSRALSQTHIQG